MAIRMPVNRKRVPLWHSIDLVLRHKIDSGEFATGAALPSEPALAASFGVSRMTIRAALGSLASDGLVRQVQGKGTFVLGSSYQTDDVGMVSSYIGNLEYNEAFPALSPDPTHRVPQCSSISLRTSQVPVDVRRVLELHDPTIVVVERVVTHGADRVGYVADYLPHVLGDRLTERDLADAWLTQVLTDKLGIHVLEAHQTITATLADSLLGDKLQVPFGAPLLHAERVYFGPDARPLYVAKVWHRADSFKYLTVFRFHHAARGAEPVGIEPPVVPRPSSSRRKR